MAKVGGERRQKYGINNNEKKKRVNKNSRHEKKKRKTEKKTAAANPRSCLSFCSDFHMHNMQIFGVIKLHP